MFTMNSINLMLGSKSFCGVNMKRIGDDKPGILRLSITEVLKLFASGDLRSCVLDQKNNVFKWTEVAKVQLLMESRKTVGKIVFLVEDNEEENEDEEKDEENDEDDDKDEEKDDADETEGQRKDDEEEASGDD
eukprot:TRINITY_DN8747_c0_g1_i1.p1 TRINITY_DN8747_c0_g1~~TRINITY_DN8747_c0_g1_i1.p1  ORF type:complete len:133 (-),score=38.42 TRINITY_DN8747_c0_g1_i1:94-492(-)